MGDIPGEAGSITTLLNDIGSEQQRHSKFARGNYRAAFLLSILTVLASFAAVIGAAGKWYPGWVLAVVSAIPGGVAIVLAKLRFEERSDWHYRRSYALRRIINEARYEKKNEGEISKAWNDLTDDFEKVWPRFGASDSDHGGKKS